MNRRDFLKTTTAALAAAPVLGAPARPNIVLIVADDLGYGELGVQGSKDIPTPHIDSLAAEGVRFTNGYVSCPVCSPTRAGLMTGRYQQRFGHEFNPGPEDQAESNFGLPLTETTLADRMKKLGYATAMVGKWHLGYRPELQPQKRGFDEFFGFLGGAHSYIRDADTRRPWSILRGTEPADEKEYLTDAFAREAVSYIDRHRKEPFFLYLPFNAVHGPMQAAEKYTARLASIQDQRRRTFGGVLTALDDGVGRVLAKLRETKLEESTLVFFISDNGGPTPSTTSGNGPLSGYKGQVWEGGVRVPFMMRWKGRLPVGKLYEQPVISLDILPTAVAAAGGETPALDGVNLLPQLTGRTQAAPHRALYWRFGGQSAIRMGDWKLVMPGDGAAQLFNLSQDIAEKADLASAQPARVKELRGAYDAWNAQLVEPLWRAQRQQRKKARRR